MTFSHFFYLPNDYYREVLVKGFLSFTDVFRLFIADQSRHFQLDMLIALLETGKTTTEIDIVTVLLARFIQQCHDFPTDIKRLTPALLTSLQSPNTTLAHQLAGKLLLSGQRSLPYSEALASNLQVISSDPDLAKAVRLLFIAGDEKLQEAILQILQATSPQAEIVAPSPEHPRVLPLKALYHFFSTDKISDSLNSKLRSTSVSLSEAQDVENINKFLTLLLNSREWLTCCNAADTLGRILSAPVFLPEGKREEVINALLALFLNNDQHNHVRGKAADALGRILSAPVLLPEGKREEVVNALLALFLNNDQDNHTRSEAASALGHILRGSISLPEGKREEVVNALLTPFLTNSQSRPMRCAAAIALGLILSTSVSLPEGKHEEVVNALLGLLNETSSWSFHVVIALGRILSAPVFLPEGKREEVVIALLRCLNNDTDQHLKAKTREALRKILEVILDEIKNPPPQARWSENAKATIVTELLHTEDEMGAQYLQKFIFWDKEMRSIISDAAPAFPGKIKKLHAIIGLVEACESAPSQALQITSPPEVGEDLSRATFKP